MNHRAALSPQHQQILDQIDAHGASQRPTPTAPVTPLMLAAFVWFVGMAAAACWLLGIALEMLQ